MQSQTMHDGVRTVSLLTLCWKGKRGRRGKKWFLVRCEFQKKLLLIEDLCHSLTATQWIHQRETRNFRRVMKTRLFFPMLARELQGNEAPSGKMRAALGR